tara:strand:- start:368 stop:1657 length:1290 start_codon:yes stop_codon:yes gene_type:complete
MTFLQPSYLWGLLALAIPIAIHLWSRKKVRTIKVGSTQYITETKSKQSNSIQLNEWLLLALRCLIISSLVFILAEPHVSKAQERADIAYVFEPALLATEEGRSRFNQIPEENRRLLSEGFPEWQEDGELIIGDEQPNYWQLAQQMDEIAADSIVLFTHAFAKAVKGKRPVLKNNINWIHIDVENPVSEPLIAYAKKDSIDIINVESDATKLAFAKTKISLSEIEFNAAKDSIEIQTERGSQLVAVQNPKILNVTILYDKAEDAQRMYMEAAFRAIQKYTDRDLKVNAIGISENNNLEGSDYLVVLSDSVHPDNEIRSLIFQPDALAKALIVPGNRPAVSFLTKKLSPQIVLEEQLVEQLLEWMQLDQELEGKIEALDKRAVSINELQTKVTAETAVSKKTIEADMSAPLWILLLLLIIGERLLAFIRKQ